MALRVVGSSTARCQVDAGVVPSSVTKLSTLHNPYSGEGCPSAAYSFNVLVQFAKLPHRIEMMNAACKTTEPMRIHRRRNGAIHRPSGVAGRCRMKKLHSAFTSGSRRNTAIKRRCEE